MKDSLSLFLTGLHVLHHRVFVKKKIRKRKRSTHIHLQSCVDMSYTHFPPADFFRKKIKNKKGIDLRVCVCNSHETHPCLYPFMGDVYIRAHSFKFFFFASHAHAHIQPTLKMFKYTQHFTIVFFFIIIRNFVGKIRKFLFFSVSSSSS